jgi:transcription initiation factor TFIIB
MASKLFRRVQNEGLLHGRTVEGVAAGTVALANQIDGPFRQYAEIASVSQVSKKKCLDVVRMLQQEFDIEVEVAHPRAYVDRIVSDLGIAAQVGKGVHELLEGVDNKIIFDGRKPSGTAAAAVYAVADGLGIDVTQQEIAKAAEVCPATIRKQYKELYKEADMDLVQ